MRRIIGGLFAVYGVILTLTGIVAGSSPTRKTQGIDINLWAAIAMLVVSVLFLLWMRLSNEAPSLDDLPGDRPPSHSRGAGPAERRQRAGWPHDVRKAIAVSGARSRGASSRSRSVSESRSGAPGMPIATTTYES